MLLDWAWPTDEAAMKLRPFILERRAGKGRKWAAQMWVRQWSCLCISRLNFTSDTGREEPSLPCSEYYPDWRCWSARGRVSDQKLCLSQTVSILHFIPPSRHITRPPSVPFLFRTSAKQDWLHITLIDPTDHHITTMDMCRISSKLYSSWRYIWIPVLWHSCSDVSITLVVNAKGNYVYIRVSIAISVSKPSWSNIWIRVRWWLDLDEYQRQLCIRASMDV